MRVKTLLMTRNVFYILVFYAAFAITLAFLSLFKADVSVFLSFITTPWGALFTMVFATVVTVFGAFIAVKTDYSMVGYALAAFGLILSLASLMAIVTFLSHVVQLLWPPKLI